MKKTALLSLSVIGLVAAGFTAFYPKSAKSKDLAPRSAKSDQMVETDPKTQKLSKPAWDKPLISATTDITLDRPQSIVYCPTITVAWQELRKSFELAEPTDFTNKLDKDAETFVHTALPDGGYTALCGIVADGIIEKIQKVHQQLFEQRLVLESNQPENIIIYSALKHEITFPLQFSVLCSPHNDTTFTDSEKVTYKNKFTYFGSTGTDGTGGGVEVITHDEEGFTLRLPDKDGRTHSVILSMFTKNPATLEGAILQTYKRLQTWAHNNSPIPNLRDFRSYKAYVNQFTPALLRPKDKLTIPVLALDQLVDFDELENLQLTSDQHISSQNAIERAQQKVTFDLTNAGAKVSSYALMGIKVNSGDAFREVEPRHFHFNRPFLCTLWKDGEAMPYLAVWVNGPDVLVKAEQPPPSKLNNS